MRRGLILGLLAGLALAVALVCYFGLGDIAQAIASAGWAALAVICAVHMSTIVICGLAWQILMPPGPKRAAYFLFFWARWLRDSVSNLLGFLPGAGEIAAARELTIRGVSMPVAAATSLVDTTAELLSQLVFTLLGIFVLIATRPGMAGTWWALLGLGIATFGIGGFLIAQRKGFVRFLETLPQRLGFAQLTATAAEGETVHAATQEIHERPSRVAASTGLHLIAWLVGVGEAWAILQFMGKPLAATDILALEALVFALRSVAFIVPSAIGVQEGGYIAIGAIFGLDPETALALSLLKRAREIATGVPALIAAQVFEGCRLWRDLARERLTVRSGER